MRLVLLAGPLGLYQQALERRGVEVVRAHEQGVSGGAGQQHPVREHLPQLGDVGLQNLSGADRRLLPQVLDQPATRDRGARLQQQQGKQRALLRGGHRDDRTLMEDLEGAQNPELHQHPLDEAGPDGVRRAAVPRLYRG